MKASVILHVNDKLGNSSQIDKQKDSIPVDLLRQKNAVSDNRETDLKVNNADPAGRGWCRSHVQGGLD